MSSSFPLRRLDWFWSRTGFMVIDRSKKKCSHGRWQRRGDLGWVWVGKLGLGLQTDLLCLSEFDYKLGHWSLRVLGERSLPIEFCNGYRDQFKKTDLWVFLITSHTLPFSPSLIHKAWQEEWPSLGLLNYKTYPSFLSLFRVTRLKKSDIWFYLITSHSLPFSPYSQGSKRVISNFT